MEETIRRKRSSSAIPSIPRLNLKEKGPGRSRFYSVSTEVRPEETGLRRENSAESNNSHNEATFVTLPSLSNVGFQSIFQNAAMRKSQQSIDSSEEYGAQRADVSPATSHRSSTIGSQTPRPSNSHSSTNGSRKRSESKTNRSLLRISNDKIEKTSRLFHNNNNKSNVSLSPSALNIGPSSQKSPLTRAARKLFHRRSSSATSKSDSSRTSPNVSSSAFGRFLQGQYSKHVNRNSMNYIHSGPNLADSTKTGYALNGAHMGNVPLQLIEDVRFDATDVHMLHDLIKNVKSLESNYKAFTTAELEALMANIWGILGNVVLSLFKNKELWDLPAKVEDINRVFEFYIKLKTESKAASSSIKFLAEIVEFLATSLYILENDIVFNYKNESTINTALKRLCVIWEVFYHNICRNVIALLLPLDVSFQTHSKFWADAQSVPLSDLGTKSQGGNLSLDLLLLRSFRDSIVLPYYHSFVDNQVGTSKNFQMYIMNEEEEKGVTQQDKLVLLQCFGLLSSIQTKNKDQTIIDDLLAGIRMSI
ncbi:LAMI_0H10506g1_1 [Lachancea mirantina]|uniref:LAMI_0H10506g1_1 n=1 Tax=Lachancea mirantina TaxID=1230905 RepID=A0A1G4KGV6_9SACH|nr:LAMI_0H10506g1_1 [Lachancea mirantina]